MRNCVHVTGSSSGMEGISRLKTVYPLYILRLKQSPHQKTYPLPLRHFYFFRHPLAVGHLER